tara:strand:+ start:82 stop:765 length:684 start_codon:yes stop_codon:yes gene_type:complete
MQVIILAGGLGTRLAEYTKTIPKPMVKILGVPIIERIIKHYNKYGFKDFIVAGGYKQHILKDYFSKNLKYLNIKIVNTGKKTMTGGRIKRLQKMINGKRFMLTYGDGVSNVNLKNLLKFHNRSKNFVTLTAVRPPARFGGIKISGKKVKYFKEKSNLDEGWINGGFFVMESKIFNFLKNDKTVLEGKPLENICKKNKLGAYKHSGFWQCMDTKRDKEILEKIVKKIS